MPKMASLDPRVHPRVHPWACRAQGLNPKLKTWPCISPGPVPLNGVSDAWYSLRLVMSPRLRLSLRLSLRIIPSQEHRCALLSTVMKSVASNQCEIPFVP